MAKETTHSQPDHKNGHKPKPVMLNEQTHDYAAVAEMPGGLVGADGNGNLETQAARLNDARLQAIQRQKIASHIGQMQGNQHLQRVIQTATQNGKAGANGRKTNGNDHPAETGEAESLDLEGLGASGPLAFAGADSPPNGNGKNGHHHGAVQKVEEKENPATGQPAAPPSPTQQPAQAEQPQTPNASKTQQPDAGPTPSPNGTSAEPAAATMQAPAPAPPAPQKDGVAPEEKTFPKETTPAGELKENDAGDQGAAEPEQEPAQDEQKAPASPGQDPAFKAVVNRGKHVAFQQGHNNPAQQKAMAAQAAAQGPANEVASQAAAAQVGKMAAKEPQAFDKEGFKRQLRTKIQEITPKDQDEVNAFKSSGKAAAVKTAVTSAVDDGKDKAQGPIEDTAKETPDSSGTQPKAVTPLPPNDPGAAPPDLRANQAAPKPKADSEISLEKESKSLDDQMVKADVTEEQLEKSNEPEFTGALSSKKDAQKHAQEAPVAYRQEEQQIVGNAKTEAMGLAAEKTAGMHNLRKDQFGKITNSQTSAKSDDEKKRAEVSKNVEDIYKKTKQKVETRLKDLDTKVNELFDQGAEQARKSFENEVDESKTFLNELLQAVGLSDEIQEAITRARANYIAAMDRVIDSVANAVEIGLKEAKDIIAAGQLEISKYVASLPKDLQDVGKKAADDIQTKFDALREQVDEKKNQLVDSLAQKYVANLKELDKRVQQLRDENKSWMDKAKDAIAGVIDTIIKLKDMLMNTLARAGDAIDKIIKDPIGFLGNLLSGIQLGLSNFVSNIGTHLKKGLMTWLFGEVAKAGITLPETFDLKGILSLALQILGISWANLRARAVNMFGEKVVAALEKAWEVFNIVRTQGIGALWEYIKDQLTNLKDMVLDGIKDMVITEVIKAGVQWLIGVLGGPAGAFVKAAKAIYDVIMWFINNGSRLMSLVNSIIDSVSAIAAGNISGAAKFIENSLAQAIPTVIGFLASLLGLGDLGAKIKGIIEKIQEPVNKAIDWVLGKAKAVVTKMASLFKGKDKKDGKDKEPENPEVKAGLKTLYSEEEARAADKTISKEDAEAIAQKVRSNHPVFKSITPIESENTWDYDYVVQTARATGHHPRTGGIPDQRYLPPGFEVRQHLYENGSGFGSEKKKVKEEELEKIREDVRSIRSDETTERQKTLLWNRLVREGKVPPDEERDKYTVAKVNAAEYDVDHIKPLAKHWHESGFNSGDAARQNIAGQRSNLQLLLASVNRSKGGEGYKYADKPYVGRNFSSDYNNCPKDSLRINGQWFRDESGAALR